MKKFNFLDVHFTYDSLRKDMDDAYHGVMDSGMYIGGNACAGFEADFAKYCGAQHCIGVGNGLDALVLVLRAWDIGPGDEVIVPANTFIATWLAVAQLGADIVPVDADPATMNIDIEKLKAAIGPKTKAIMPVHLYGAPTPLAEVRAIAEAQGILLLEDAAQAHGASEGNGRAGTLGHAAGFSFYPGKNLGAFGDGGAVVTNDADLAAKVRRLGNYGAEIKYQHDVAGGNSRLDPLQAAFLQKKLARLDDWNARRQEIAAVYDTELAGLDGLTLPQLAPDTASVWHLYVVRHARRDALSAALAAKGVPTALHYPIPNHHSGAFKDSHGHLSFPVTEDICKTCLSLPIGPHLSVEDAHEIATRIKQTLSEL
jgi:dTDP-4-amino-4,6-dideoxygalactose transaminase